MGEAKIGEEFIKHEFDEAIAIQRAIVEAENVLSTKHPVPAAKRAVKGAMGADQTFLEQLETLGEAHDATGELEDVAERMTELMDTTLQGAIAEDADSEFYEAHAVLVSLKRKQMDSAGGMLAIAREQKDADLRKLATAMKRAQKSSSQALADELAAYAVKIAAASA
jgi:hypothetical protein